MDYVSSSTGLVERASNCIRRIVFLALKNLGLFIVIARIPISYKNIASLKCYI